MRDSTFALYLASMIVSFGGGTANFRVGCCSANPVLWGKTFLLTGAIVLAIGIIIWSIDRAYRYGYAKGRCDASQAQG